MIDYEAAIDDWTKYIEILPGSVDSYYHRGQLRAKQGNYYKAINDFNIAINLYNTYDYSHENFSYLRSFIRYIYEAKGSACKNYKNTISNNNKLTDNSHTENSNLFCINIPN